uniref:Uncharacterized protein n=1 Tax=Rhizophora mucronata TaxID=61149 RepID=A0A2P2N1A3_RHIMU
MLLKLLVGMKECYYTSAAAVVKLMPWNKIK